MPILFKTEILSQDVFLWNITETEQTLISLSELDAPNFKFEERRKTWLASRCLVKEVFKDNPEINYTEFGKPYLKNSKDCISISHSGKLIAFARSKSNCGIDIQEKNSKIDRILSKFLNDHEKEWVEELGNTSDHHHLIWCAKEALFKVYGTEVDFKDCITIKAFKVFKQGTFEATVTRKSISKQFTLGYSKLNNYYLVFTHE